MAPRSAEHLPELEPRSAGNVDVYLNPDLDSALSAEDFLALPSALESLPGADGRLPGTPTCWRWDPSWRDGPPLLVRRYAHGGLLGPLWGTVFVGSGRMRREFRLAVYAHRRGVPTATPVALRVERTFGPLVRAHYVSELIEGASNLLEFCRDVANGGSAGRDRRRVARATAEAVHKMHEADVFHADLNLTNVLVRPGASGVEAFVVDFDKARLMRPLPLPRRMANVVRLDRSIVKWAASRRVIGTLDRVRFLRFYLQGHPGWCGRSEELARRYGSRHRRHYFFRRGEE